MTLRMWVVRAGEEARFYDDFKEIELLQLARMNLDTFLESRSMPK
jgi:hypothetical protein